MAKQSWEKRYLEFFSIVVQVTKQRIKEYEAIERILNAGDEKAAIDAMKQHIYQFLTSASANGLTLERIEVGERMIEAMAKSDLSAVNQGVK